MFLAKAMSEILDPLIKHQLKKETCKHFSRQLIDSRISNLTVLYQKKITIVQCYGNAIYRDHGPYSKW